MTYKEWYDAQTPERQALADEGLRTCRRLYELGGDITEEGKQRRKALNVYLGELYKKSDEMDK